MNPSGHQGVNQVIVINKDLIVVNTSLRNPTISYTMTSKRQVRKNILVDQIFLQSGVIREE